MAESPSVVVVGAGITGLSCAAALRGRASVTVLDRVPVAGGVHGWRTAEACDLVGRCGARLRLGETAIRWDGRELLALGQDGVTRLPARALVIATGSRPLLRAELEVIGSRPAGVVSATVACHLAENGLPVGRRPLVLGGGDWASASARALLAAGARRLTVAVPGALLSDMPDDRRLDVRQHDRVVAVHGRCRVTSVELASGGLVECDALVLAHGLAPVRNVDGAVWDGHRTVYAQPIADPGSVEGARRAGANAARAVTSLVDG